MIKKRRGGGQKQWWWVEMGFCGLGEARDEAEGLKRRVGPGAGTTSTMV